MGHQGVKNALAEIGVGPGNIGHIADDFVVAIHRVKVDKAHRLVVLVGVEVALVLPVLHFHRPDQEPDFITFALTGTYPGLGDFPGVVVIEQFFNGNAALLGLVEGSTQNLLLLAAQAPFTEVDPGLAAKLGAVEAKAQVQEIHYRLGYLDVAGIREFLVKAFQDGREVFGRTDRVRQDKGAAPFAHVGNVAHAGYVKVLHARLQGRGRLGVEIGRASGR